MLKLTKGATLAGNYKAEGGGIVKQTQRNSLARTDTSAKNLFTLPANAIITAIRIWTAVLSDAGTSASINVGKTGTDNFYVNAFDIKGGTVKAQNNPVASNLHVSVGSALQQVVGKYTESGTASTTGGPFWVEVEYFLP